MHSCRTTQRCRPNNCYMWNRLGEGHVHLDFRILMPWLYLSVLSCAVNVSFNTMSSTISCSPSRRIASTANNPDSQMWSQSWSMFSPYWIFLKQILFRALYFQSRSLPNVLSCSPESGNPLLLLTWESSINPNKMGHQEVKLLSSGEISFWKKKPL